MFKRLKTRVAILENNISLLEDKIKKLECGHPINKRDFFMSPKYLFDEIEMCSECGKVFDACDENRKKEVFRQKAVYYTNRANLYKDNKE